MYTQQIIMYNKIKNMFIFMIDTGMRYYIYSIQTFKKALVNVPDEGKIKTQKDKNVIIYFKQNLNKEQFQSFPAAIL